MTPEQIAERKHAAEWMEHRGPWLMEYRSGFLFVGRDGNLYKAEFECDSERRWAVKEQPKANGWTVDQVRSEFWHGVFPPYEVS